MKEIEKKREIRKSKGRENRRKIEERKTREKGRDGVEDSENLIEREKKKRKR